MKIIVRLRDGSKDEPDEWVQGTFFERIIPETKMLEEAGVDGVAVSESNHDPFVSGALAAAHSKNVEISTGIALAFSRNPMSMAYAAHDLQVLSKGRFSLGLGSQIRAHITKRFSMPWSHPAARMKEFVRALYAIWDCWNEGKPLEFRGEFYSHTLMTPTFAPAPSPYGRPRVLLGAVGPLMTAAAAEVADGWIGHSFTTERYLKEVTLPALQGALAKRGLPRRDFELVLPPFVVFASDSKAMAARTALMREQIAFYCSTPAYRDVLHLHGWGDVHPELNALSKQGRWKDMAGAISDDMLHTYAVVGTPREVVAELRRRYSGLVDALSIRPPFTTMPEVQAMLRELKA